MAQIIKLKASDENEERILAYLNEQASIGLCERINKGNKTLTQCWNYITSEARKLAHNGCACIEDGTVFGWAIHFFEEDSIVGKNFATREGVASSTGTESKKNKPAKQPQKEPKSQDVYQICFDF